MKNQSMNVNSYWNSLNSLPVGQRAQVVNPKIIERDKQSCANILTGMLKDKQEEDEKKQVLAKERLE